MTDERTPSLLTRMQQGAKAQSIGVLFESMFTTRCYQHGIGLTRIPNGCKTLGPKRLMRVTSPFDFVITYDGRTALIDTKATSGNLGFPYSKITDHQVHEMAIHEKRQGLGGYVIWLRKTNQVIFVNATYLLSLMSKRGTISPSGGEIIQLGTHANFDPRLIFSKAVCGP